MRRTSIGLICTAGFVAIAAMASCAETERGSGYVSGAGGSGAGGIAGGGNSGGSSGGTAGGGDGGGGGAIVGGPSHDFPAEPVIDTSTSTPANAAGLFGSAGPGGAAAGPCIVEPESGTLFPNNWLRPRFRFLPPAGQNLFEIRVHSGSQANDLVVYTSGSYWTMPADMWKALALHAVDQPITVSIRGGFWDGASLTNVSMPSQSGFTVAPVDASGSIVYWTTTGDTMLKGFTIGDETVAPTLTPSQVQMPPAGRDENTTCIGCHTSTPDGKFAGFTTQDPWGNSIASVEKGQNGAMPPFLGNGAIAALQNPELGIQTFSKTHWKDGDRIEIAPFGSGKNAKLAWIDLEAAQEGEGNAYGFLERSGDSRGAGAPTWSHDGSRITYVSTNSEGYGRLGAGAATDREADLYTVEYGDRAGGMATPVAGASESAYNEYYPAYSGDDALLAFNRVPNRGEMYNNKAAEIYVIPSAGGTPTRLAANDPAACSGRTSPGITNSWPKWSPDVQSSGGKKYYWLIFSSTRNGKSPQLFATAVVDSGGTLTTYPALYLWNQPANENNHTPAWDVFKIPPAGGPK